MESISEKSTQVNLWNKNPSVSVSSALNPQLQLNIPCPPGLSWFRTVWVPTSENLLSWRIYLLSWRIGTIFSSFQSGFPMDLHPNKCFKLKNPTNLSHLRGFGRRSREASLAHTRPEPKFPKLRAQSELISTTHLRHWQRQLESLEAFAVDEWMGSTSIIFHTC